MELSQLQKARYDYWPKLPGVIQAVVDGLSDLAFVTGDKTEAASDRPELKNIFKHSYGKPVVTFELKPDCPLDKRPLKLGVILSGGQAPGGHNVIAGLFDGLSTHKPGSKLIGFLGGPSGLIDCKHIEITKSLMKGYRNTGGFDMIGSGRTKIETPAQFASSLDTAKKLGLDAIVVIGGDDSNTNAALLDEYFAEKNAGVHVIGCPKTIDGDLKNEHIEASFGFDTACKTYSELIGNIERDALSAKKYWHFIKLMGRAASHIALECALQTHPNICLISEEVAQKQITLQGIVDQIAEAVVKRSEKKENFGVVLVPEGLVEFIPKMGVLISELNDIMSQKDFKIDFATLGKDLTERLSADAASLFRSLVFLSFFITYYHFLPFCSFSFYLFSLQIQILSY
jgi:pyrophosphate--fructose-6-phosphate 1-phosphotransferase